MSDDAVSFLVVLLVLVGLPTMGLWMRFLMAAAEERHEARHVALIAVLQRGGAHRTAHAIVRRRIGFSSEPRACLPPVVHHPESSGDTERLASPRARGA